MSELNNKDEMLKDLQFIKEAVKKNNNLLKYISLSEGIKNVALFSGIFITVISLILLWMIGSYGSYQDLPTIVKLSIYLFLGVSFIGLILIKIKVFLKIVRRHRKDITFTMLMREVYTRTLLTIMIPFLITIVVFCVYFSINGLTFLIVPILAILLSLLMVSFMIVLNFQDLLLSFQWLLFSGLFSLFIAELLHPLVILIFTFGITMFILYVSAQVSISKGKSG
ncbi:MAG: hypothetical protein AB7V16_01510 [Vulcanibacillus sp.]